MRRATRAMQRIRPRLLKERDAMRVETGLPLGNWRAVPEAARRAEANGFDGVLSYEIQNDPFAPLVHASIVTERIRLGTAIAVCFPRSPMVMANIARDLHA